MIGTFRDLLRGPGGEWILSFTVRDDPRTLLDKLKDKVLSIDIKKFDKKRSLDANAFCWAMCSDIGKAIRPPIPKEEVYRKAIRDVGRFFPVPVRDDLVGEWQRSWGRNGVGWFADVTDRSKNPGYTLMLSYCGTSVYTSSEMSVVLEYLKDEMEQLGLPIPLSKKEEERMMAEWQKAFCKRNGAAISADALTG